VFSSACDRPQTFRALGGISRPERRIDGALILVLEEIGCARCTHCSNCAPAVIDHRQHETIRVWDAP